MANFVFLYYEGEKAASTAATPEQMEAWTSWFKGLGEKIVDAGAPFNSNGMAVSNGSVDPVGSWPATGYTIVSAGSIEDAVSMSKGCPVFKAKDGMVRVYESLSM